MKTEEKTQHTPGTIKIGMRRTGRLNPWDESWEYQTALYSTTNQIKLAVVEEWIGKKEQLESEANVDRFVAAWNACEGISTKALEDGAVEILIKMLEALNEWIDMPEVIDGQRSTVKNAIVATLNQVKGE